MSPTRAATLDGEINGPNYATVDGPPGMTGQNDDQNSGQVMNGIEPGPSSSSAIPPEATLPQHLGPAGLSNAADFLTATTSTKEPEGDARPLPPVPPGFSQDFAVPAGSATQHVGGFSFSPPEDFPAETRNADPASQTFWFAKIGEFVQRRVAQAGAAMTPILESRQSLRQVVTTPPRVQRLFTPEAEQAMSQWTRRAPHLFTPDQRAPQQEGSSNGSLTQEQVMAEVHKQVKLELRAHEEERQQLSDENQQLKAMLEKVLTQDPREAITSVVVAAILANYFLLPVYLGVILLYRNQALLYVDMMEMHVGVFRETSKALLYQAVIHGMRGNGPVAGGYVTVASQQAEGCGGCLPRLPDLSANSAIDFGDWLHGLQNHMGDLSNSSSQWWTEVLGCLSRFYEAYLAASHLRKLALRAVDYETSELRDDKWSRVDKRAASMILASVPDGVKAVGTLASLARIVILYRPGSMAERQQILKALEAPSGATTAAGRAGLREQQILDFNAQTPV
eukprot:s9529_g3.t1